MKERQVDPGGDEHVEVECQEIGSVKLASLTDLLGDSSCTPLSRPLV